MGTGLSTKERASSFAGKDGRVSFLRTPLPPRGTLLAMGVTDSAWKEHSFNHSHTANVTE